MHPVRWAALAVRFTSRSFIGGDRRTRGALVWLITGGNTARYLSEDEARAAPIAAMGPQLGELFSALSAGLRDTVWTWQQYTTLFGDSPTRLDVLNATAPDFFWILQHALWENAILSIARLTGPPQSRGKQNLSIRRLPDLTSGASGQAEIVDRVNLATQAAVFAADWRNRRLAHFDLDLAVGRHAIPLPPAAREDVDHALDAIENVLNHVESTYQRSTTAYRHSPLLHDAEGPLFSLSRALGFERACAAALDSGDFDLLHRLEDIADTQ